MAWGITINPHSLRCPSGVLAPLSVTWPRLGLLPFLFGTAIAARGCGAAAGVLAAHRGQALRGQVAAGTTKREHTFRAGTCEVSGRVRRQTRISPHLPLLEFENMSLSLSIYTVSVSHKV